MTDTSPLSAIRKWWSKYGPTDGPGHSDYPEVDIKTHRRIARVHRWLGYAVILISAYLFIQNNEVNTLLAGAVMAAVTWWVEIMYRLEALEWEVQLARGNDDD